MSNVFFPDIPRFCTALAEWAACVIYILPLKKRLDGKRLYAALLGFLPLQMLEQSIAGRVGLALWVPFMILAVCLMYLTMFSCCDISAMDAGYCTARAFVTAEFVASLQWQLFYYVIMLGYPNGVLAATAFLLLVYGLLFFCIYRLEMRRMPRNVRIGVSARETLSALILALAVFAVSNLSYLTQDTVFAISTGPGIMMTRTLVDLCGLALLFLQHEQRQELQLKLELEAMNKLFERQLDQYQISKESIEVLNRSYHDLKHQIAVIRAEHDPKKRDGYLAEMDFAISMYEAQNKTGNSVLDVLLTAKSMTCAQHNIKLTIVADGTLLHFMNAMDICSIFGNALDNAMEYVMQLEEDKRLIRVALYAQNQFVMLRFENYCEDMVEFEDGLPKTTKKDRQLHGYGVKSIEQAAEKYGGTITVQQQDNWFYLRILLPVTKKSESL